jgi:opacity protein-like surface antigen
MRKLLLIAFVCLTAFGASAQRAELFGGYSYMRAGYLPIQPVGTVNLNGWDASIAYKPIRWIGLVADVGGTYGSARSLGPLVGCPAVLCSGPNNVSTSSYTVLFGPRLYVPIGRVTPFIHVMAGAVHVSNSGETTNALTSALGTLTDTSVATALGGGLDFRVIPGLAIRVAQLDYIRTGLFSIPVLGNSQNNFRFSTGVVFRF